MSYDTANNSPVFTACWRLYPIKGYSAHDKMTILRHVSVTRLEHMSFFPPAQRVKPF